MNYEAAPGKRASASTRRLPGLLVAASLTACSSWQPPVLSPALESPGCGDASEPAARRDSPTEPARSGESGTGSASDGAPAGADPCLADHACSRLQAAIDDARALQRRYLAAAGCGVRDSNTGALALLGLSTLALFKAATGLNPRDAAGIGALGAGVYVGSGLSNTQLNKRRSVLYAGADALCQVMRDAEPYRLPVQVSAGGGRRTIEQLAAAARGARAALSSSAGELAVHRTQLETRVQVGKPAAKGCDTLDPTCSAADADCARLRGICPPPASSRVPMPVDPAVDRMLDRLETARQDIDALIDKTADLTARIEMAPAQVAQRSSAIQTAVARGYEDSYLDGEKLLAALGSMKSTAFKVTRASVFELTDGAPDPAKGGSMQSKPVPHRKLPTDEMNRAQAALLCASTASAALREALLVFEKRIEALQADRSACRPLVLPGFEVAPPEATPRASTEGGGPPAGETPPIATSALPLPQLASMLGLTQDAQPPEVEAKLRQCQRVVLRRADADGKTVDAQTRDALLQGRCIRGAA